MAFLNENTTVNYRVVYNGNVLLDNVSKPVAENFVSTLTIPVKESVSIIPVTNDGLQVLLG